MWFGTDSGLARFDGRRTETIVLNEGSPLKILALETGENGTIWIGTDMGPYRYQNGNFEKIIDKQDPDSEQAVGGFDKKPVNVILTGDPVVMASSEGYFFNVPLDPRKPPYSKYIYGHPAGEHAFTGIARIPGGLAIGTYGGGIAKFTDDTEVSFISRPLFINTLAQGPAGKIWIGADSDRSGSGLYTMGENEAVERLGSDLGSVIAIEPDGNNGAWAGTAKMGLYHFVEGKQTEHLTFENTAGGLRSNTINSVFLDREGVLWIGTPHGVCRYDSSSPYIQALSDNASSNFARTLYRGTDGRILAGTNLGLFILDGDKWGEYPAFPRKRVYAITEGATGKMLIGGPGGVFDVNGKRVLEGDVRAFANFHGKTYAAVFDRGLEAIDEPNSPHMFPGGTPTTLYSTPEKLWIGTSGSDVFSFNSQTITAEPGFEDQRLGAIWRIAPSGGGELWVACSTGLYLYKDGALTRVVANYDVRDIIANGSDVWAATQNGGLLHIRQDEMFGWVVSDLNVEQGLPSQQVFSLLQDGNRLMVGTNRGVVTYTPGSVLPKVIISRVLSRRLHNPEEWTRNIDLEYPQNSLVVEVAGQSSRTFPEQFQYSFVLKDSKGDVIEKRLSRDSQFSPASLQPGAYTIEARAFNKDLLFSEPVTVSFTIGRAPFPWTATALGVLLFIALVALVMAVAERRQLSKRNRELAAARRDLANEAERERRRIARELHDQTLADLRNLMMMSDKLVPDNTEFRAEIESVSTEVRRICEDLSPSVLENVGLAAALEFLVSHTIEDHRFTAAEGLEDQLNFPLNTQVQIYRIAQEVLTNIKRHSSARLVEMDISVSGDAEFVLQVRDDGAPFNPDAISTRGRGISNIRARASLIRAEIDWRSIEPTGTAFILRKPIE